MNNRRRFLKQAGSLAALAPLAVRPFFANSYAQSTSVPGAQSAAHEVGWTQHAVWQGNENDGWIMRPAKMCYLHWGDGKVQYFQLKGGGIKPLA